MPEPRAYYNEHDKFAAAWLRNLIAAGHLAPGDVDERDIRDVRPDDLTGYTQCHFFAGIGVWSHALRRAGWPDRRPVWTGSCPCQPFSQAGKGAGLDDERHLWPAFFHLIEQCHPRELFGEQVASKDGLAWLDLVQSDMEGSDYAFGALDICAAGFGAPHIRQRLYWAAHANNARLERRLGVPECSDQRATRADSVAGELADASDGQLSQPWRGTERRDGRGPDRQNAPAGPVNGVWRNADWLLCRDGKWRPVEAGTSPLSHGNPGRVGRLRAYGNAIVAPQAEAFIAAYLDADQHFRLTQEGIFA